MEITGVTFEGGITVGAPSVAGVLYSWGYNQIYGQLGLGDKTNRYAPTQVTAGATPWKQIASGRNTSGTFSGAVANNGTLWTWGSNSSGALGQGSYSGNEKSTPAQVGTLNTWRQLTLGNNCGLAIMTNGTLWAWGDNGAGQLGLGAGVSGPASPRQVGADTTWVQVDSNRGNSTFGIKSDGTLWAWGSNFNGQLGLGTAGFPNISSPVKVGLLTNWAQVAGGKGESTFAVKTDGTLWAWGRNVTGTLGTNDTINRSSPVQIGADTNWAFVASGCGSSNSTAAIKTNGTLWTWGDNGSGQLGQGNTTARSSPTQVGTQTNWAFVSVGGSFMLATKTDGTLWSWGSDTDGTLGQGGTGNKNSPVQIGVLTWWGSAASSYIAAGPREGFAITKIVGAQNPPIQLNTVTGTPPIVYVGYSWGYNVNGELGQGNVINRSSPVQLPGVSDWTKFAGGVRFNLAIKQNGTLWGWGQNNGGQLGQNNVVNRSSPVQIGSGTDWAEIENYYLVSGAIKTNGTLWTWGTGLQGQLGRNNTTAYSSPVQLGTDTNWSSIAFGFQFGSATKTTGTLWSWGYNGQGQLGQNDTVTRSSPVQVGTDTNWVKVWNGSQFTVGLKTNGTLWAWGYNNKGQLGQNNANNYSSPVQIGTDNTWTTTLSVGDDHCVAVKSDGTLWTWGNNGSGQLGINSSVYNSSSPVQVGTGTNWRSAGAGNSFTMAMKTDGTVWSWGSNSSGELGLGNTTRRSSPVQIGSSTWGKMFTGQVSGDLIAYT